MAWAKLFRLMGRRTLFSSYKIAGSTPTLYGAVTSYNRQLDKRCHVGASSALDLRGFSHFVAMGKPLGFLFTDKDSRLPGWFEKTEWNMTVKYFTTSVFGAETCLESYDYNGSQLLISSPERAFMECLLLSPEQFVLLDSYYVMEMMTTLRPSLVQRLLEECSSIKVKRLFLYMAEKAGHSWFRALDISRINLGSGVRNISVTVHLFRTGGTGLGPFRIRLFQGLPFRSVETHESHETETIQSGQITI